MKKQQTFVISIKQWLGLKIMKIGANMAFSESKSKFNNVKYQSELSIRAMIITFFKNQLYIAEHYSSKETAELRTEDAFRTCLLSADKAFLRPVPKESKNDHDSL